MLEMRIKRKNGSYKIVRLAEWKDCEKIVERHLKKNKAFYEQLAKL